MIGVTIAAWAKWDIAISRGALNAWAAREGLELLESKNRSLFRGPYTWNSRKTDTVFLVTARGPDGQVRKGWVRVAQNAQSGVDVQWLP